MAAGDAFITALTLMGPYATNYAMGGIMLAVGVTHGAGNQVFSLNFITTSGQTNDIRSGTNYNASGSPPAALNTTPGVLTYIRVVMTATNTWRLDCSPDGITWIKGTATLARTLTPTHVGLHTSSWASVTKHAVSYEFLRRQAGVT